MERLTERFSNGQAAVRGCGSNCKYDYKYCESHLEDCPTIGEIYEKLAEYEDLEDQGRLLRLPCAVGDRIYIISKTKEIKERKVIKFEMVAGRWAVNAIDWFYWFEEFGKIVFLTLPEAEQALKEMEGKK